MPPSGSLGSGFSRAGSGPWMVGIDEVHPGEVGGSGSIYRYSVIVNKAICTPPIVAAPAEVPFT